MEEEDNERKREGVFTRKKTTNDHPLEYILGCNELLVVEVCKLIND